MSKPIMNVLAKAHVDSTVIYVLLQRGWTSISGVVTLVLLISFLSEEELGYYYSFLSIVGIQMLFELGLTTVIRQFVSHKYSESDEASLFALVKKALQAYLIIVVSMFVSIIIFSFFFFSNETEVEWGFAWYSLALFASLNCFMLVVTAILEGVGYIKNVKRIQYYSVLLSSLFVWLVIYFGFGLFSLAVLNLVNFLVVLLYVLRKHSAFFLKALNSDGSHFSWKKELWPIQRKTVVSYMGGYFIFYMVNPIAFKFFGPEFSGKLGFSFQITNLVLSLSASLINTKMPSFSEMISNERHKELYVKYCSIQKYSLLFYTLISFGVVFSYYILDFFDFYIVEKMMPIEFIVMLLVMGFFRCAINCHACYIRSYREEKHGFNAMLTALFLVILLFYSAIYLNEFWFVLFYCSVVVCVSFPHSYYLLKKFKGEIYG